MKKAFHVIPHTHWDFEWYFSTHESLIQLIYHMDEVMSGLENGKSDTYLLDGQLSIVEDYLAHCPEQTERFMRLVKQGKLKIGPWYTQADQLIVGGESIVRNLVAGIRLGEQYGPVMKIGYVPDSFGQSIDMPKIYQGVGIDKTVFWRGLSTDICQSREFKWQCEDGSEVLAYNIKNGYFVGSYLIDFDDPTPLCHQAEEGAIANNIAIPLGGDQRYIDLNIKQRIALSDQATSDYKIVESCYEQLFDALAEEDLALPCIRGEFIDGQVSKIHRSIYSSRYDHKYLNDKIERRLSYQLEPLMVMADALGIAPKNQLVDSIWKVIMRNHAHDSAGGCNTDKTNKIILSRYEQADQMSGSAVDYLVRKLAESQPSAEQGGIDGRLTLFNTLPYPRNQVMQVTISTQSPDFILCDLKGNPVSFDITQVEKTYRGSIQRDEADNDPDYYYYQTDIELSYPLPASGFVSLQVCEQQVCEQDKSEENPKQPLSTAVEKGLLELEIENSRYQLVYRDGQLNLLDKQQQRWWHDCIRLIDMGDDGDTYDYSPPEKDWLLTLDWSQALFSVQKGGHSQTLFVEGTWALPKDLDARAKRACNGGVGYRLAFRLEQVRDGQEHTGSNCPLKIEAELDNQVGDHRMQLVVTGPFSTQTSWSDTPFGVVERANVPAHLKDWREADWKEEPSPIYPMLHFANMHDESTSLTLLAKGVKEYEVLAENQLALTLFRSVGWLGKPNLQRRPGIASGQQFKYIPTPDSQLLGKLNVECALVIESKFEPASVQRTWQHYAVDVLDYQNQSLNQFTNTLKYFVMHPLSHSIPDNFSGYHFDCPELVVSAIKPADDGDGYVVRLYNPNSFAVEQPGSIIFQAELKHLIETDLLEQELKRYPVHGEEFSLDGFAAKQIRTFKWFK
ncbi:glycosyl hydrolase-related protein [Photobacterium sp. SDRW27]|uniref:glycoside hydrolase family 38 N-terminal domain-containing protein n=1 Tax=Photobacterium obscurum TaxID=2829490 RepID=UPI002242F861|nr:glycoside hydrolase family 38 C-terminal domain-containing protein [Photobacterium obscurum]MCW8329216.1 glycosyl hydrolase-related protein [Photobacterium obscurum]